MASMQAAQAQVGIPGQAQPQQQQQQVVSKEYYVKVPKTKKRYHALKFHTASVDLANMNKAEMVKDVVPQAQRQEWEQLPKAGQGSEYGREAKELYRRKKFGYMAKKKNVDDMPWILSNKATDKHYIGKKSVSENSSYFVFIKCADGGFEASPLEDWYSFAPHKTYKTLNHDEAEEQFKIRHKTLNKYYIMVNKRKTEGMEEEEDDGDKVKTGISSFGMSGKASKDSWVSDGEEDKRRPSKKKTDYKASNLSDDDDDDDEPMNAKEAKGKKGKNDDDEEVVAKEDSDDGDQEGVEMDYSSSDSEFSEPEKVEEKYQEIGIDEEEAIKAQNKSDDSDSEEDEDAGLTEAGKEYKKLMTKDGDKDSDEFDDIFKGKKDGDSSSSFDDSDFESETAKQRKSKQAQKEENKLKRKASDELIKKPDTKKQVINQDESSSSSSTTNLTSKSTKTAAIIAAAAAATSSKQAVSGGHSRPTATSTITKSSTSADRSDSSVLTEEEVRRYLSRKPMTSKELLHKFRAKSQSTQNKLTNEELVEKLRVILDRLKAKMIEQNGVKYLTLP